MVAPFDLDCLLGAIEDRGVFSIGAARFTVCITGDTVVL